MNRFFLQKGILMGLLMVMIPVSLYAVEAKSESQKCGEGEIFVESIKNGKVVAAFTKCYKRGPKTKLKGGIRCENKLAKVILGKGITCKACDGAEKNIKKSKDGSVSLAKKNKLVQCRGLKSLTVNNLKKKLSKTKESDQKEKKVTDKKIKEIIDKKCKENGGCTNAKKEKYQKDLKKILEDKNHENYKNAVHLVDKYSSVKEKSANKKTVKKSPKIVKKLSTSKNRNKDVKKLPKEQRKVLLKHFAKKDGAYIKKHGKYNKQKLDAYTKKIKDSKEKKIVQAYTKRLYAQKQAQKKSGGVSLPVRRPTPPTKKVATVAPGGNVGAAPPMVDTGSGSYGGGRQKPQQASSGESGGFGGIFGAISGMVQQALQKKKQQKPSTPKPPKPRCDVFTATNRSIRPGETTELRWSVRYSDFSAISGLGSVSPRQGALRISPGESTDYVLQSQNRYGSAICPTVRITVLADDTDGDALIKENPTMSCSPNTLERGGSSIILWQCPRGSTRSSGSSTEYGEFTTYGKSEGSARVAPAITSTFVVRCRDANGAEVGRNSCSVRVVESNQFSNTGSNIKERNNTSLKPLQNKSTVILKASKYQVQTGKAVTINWDGRGADNCTLTGPDGFKEIGNRGDITGRILQTSTFVLHCSLQGKILPIKEITISAI